MLKPRDGEMNYNKLEELAFYYMFLASCLSESEYNTLKERWNKSGGSKETPWWKFIAENVSVSITPQIPVVTTYSFDSDTEVVLCATDEEAEAYLAESFHKEVASDLENGWDCTSEISKDGRYAKITNKFNDRTDVTEFSVGHIMKREV